MGRSKVEKEFDVDGLKCFVIGFDMGHRCGYVGVPKEHILFGKEYREVEVFDVHGGLTFSDHLKEQSKDFWFFGFDCAHYNDGKDFELIKELCDENRYKRMVEIETLYPVGGKIRTTGYVENECRSLAKQILDCKVS